MSPLSFAGSGVSHAVVKLAISRDDVEMNFKFERGRGELDHEGSKCSVAAVDCHGKGYDMNGETFGKTKRLERLERSDIVVVCCRK